MGGRGGSGGMTMAQVIAAKKEMTNLKRQITKANKEYMGAEGWAYAGKTEQIRKQGREDAAKWYHKRAELQERYDAIEKRVKRYAAKNTPKSDTF